MVSYYSTDGIFFIVLLYGASASSMTNIPTVLSQRDFVKCIKESWFMLVGFFGGKLYLFA